MTGTKPLQVQMGMPRRIYTYPAEAGWETLNMVATAGSAIAVLGGLVFVANAALSCRYGARAGADPWHAPTLEWATASPPPAHNFDEVPVVSSLTPLWDERGALPVMGGLATDQREVLVTSVAQALPQYRQNSVGPSIWPLISGLAVSALFVASIFTPWALVWGALPMGLALALWFWPTRPRLRTSVFTDTKS